MDPAAYFRDMCRLQPRDLIEKWAEGNSRSTYLGDSRALCRVLREFLMYVDTRDASISPHLMFRGMWEPWITQAIARRVEPGWRCLDVGANMGYYTLLLAALVGKDGHVAAIEPQPHLLQLLARTLSVNGFTDRVLAYEVAASDVHTGGSIVQSHAFLQGGVRVEAEEGGDVTLWPLDDLPGVGEDSWDFIKIDVEGAERAVMRGLKKTIDKQKRLCIAMELTPAEWDEPPGPFLDALKMQGFSVGTIQLDASVKPLDDYSTLPTEPGQWEMIWLER